MNGKDSTHSISSDHAKSVELLVSLGQLNQLDGVEEDAAMDEDQQVTVREKLNKKFGIVSLTQRNLTLDEAGKPALRGVVSIKAKRVQLYRLEDFLQQCNNVYAEISTRNVSKRTSVAPNMDGSVVWNQIRHFPVMIPKNRRHPFNLISVQVFGFDGSGTREPANLLGSLAFHLHDVIAVRAVTGLYEVWDENAVTGVMELEITFNYGLFGFGYGNQLAEARLKTEDMVLYSLFPRIIPRQEEREPQRALRIVKRVQHPVFLPLKERAHLRDAKTYFARTERVGGGGDGGASAKESSFQPTHMKEDLGIVANLCQTLLSIGDQLGRLFLLHSTLSHDTRTPKTVGPGAGNNWKGKLPPQTHVFVQSVSEQAASGTSGGAGSGGRGAAPSKEKNVRRGSSTATRMEQRVASSPMTVPTFSPTRRRASFMVSGTQGAGPMLTKHPAALAPKRQPQQQPQEQPQQQTQEQSQEQSFMDVHKSTHSATSSHSGLEHDE